MQTACVPPRLRALAWKKVEPGSCGAYSVAPPRRGFGTELIERQLKSTLRGEASLDFVFVGLVVHISIPYGKDILAKGSRGAQAAAMGGLAAGHRILVVEDEMLLAMDIEELVRAAGCTVIGPVGTMPDAMRKLRETRPDGAILDVNISGEMVFPIADALHEAGIPFMIVTGYTREHVPERHRHRPFLQKPYKAAVLVAMLSQMLDEAQGGRTASEPQPKSA
jgi:CheY-like chemotaxis protein